MSTGVSGRSRPAAVLSAERPAGPSPHGNVLQHEPIQTTESLLLFIALTMPL